MEGRRPEAQVGIMYNIGKSLRLGHIVKDDNRTLIVALDHGFMGIIQGLEDIEKVVSKVIAGGADAILINFGIVKKIAHLVSRKVGIVLSIPSDPQYVELAAKIGVDAVKTTYFGRIPLNEEDYARFSAVARACEEWGIPYIVELVPSDEKGRIMYELELVKKAARIGAELGGDIVKTVYVGSINEYRNVIETCPVPIVVMGGPKVGIEKEFLQMIKNSIEAGAIGGAIGRNIWQYKDPEKMTKAISKIIHGDATVEEALKILES